MLYGSVLKTKLPVGEGGKAGGRIIGKLRGRCGGVQERENEGRRYDESVPNTKV